MKRRSRLHSRLRPRLEHRCPAAPDGRYTRFTEAQLRAAAYRNPDLWEAVERLADALNSVDLDQVSEAGVILSTFGCCKQVELVVAIEAARWVTVHYAAGHFGKAPETIRQMVKRGELQGETRRRPEGGRPVLHVKLPA